MAKINELPQEVFLNIVSEGCKLEDLDYRELYLPHPRRFKNFGKLIRTVSRRWRREIDNVVDLLAYRWLWVASACLDIEGLQMDTAQITRFLKRFLEILDNSDGCDIRCMLSLDFHESSYENSRQAAFAADLFIRGVFLLSRHQKQLVNLYFRSCYPVQVVCVPEISMILSHATNLVHLDLGTPFITPYQWTEWNVSMKFIHPPLLIQPQNNFPISHIFKTCRLSIWAIYRGLTKSSYHQNSLV